MKPKYLYLFNNEWYIFANCLTSAIEVFHKHSDYSAIKSINVIEERVIIEQVDE